MTIGILVPVLADGYHAEVMTGIGDRLLEENYFYFIAHHRHRADLIEQYPRMLISRGAEGLITIDTNLLGKLPLPVVAIAGYDLEFYEHLPYLTPQRDFKSLFAGNPELAARSAAQSGTLQVGYFILALRALGLDAGPMGGFDAAKVEAEFFPEGKIKANVVINIGYGDDAKLFPRNPRLSFDQMATVL